MECGEHIDTLLTLPLLVSDLSVCIWKLVLRQVRLLLLHKESEIEALSFVAKATF